MNSFEDLQVFQRAVELTLEIYQQTETFPRREMYGLTAQLRSAAVSIISNLGEGQGRLTPGEWRQFLSHSRGSLYEVQAQLIVAHRLHFIDDDSAAALRTRTAEVGRLLAGLIRYVRKREAALATSYKQRATSRSRQPTPP